MSILIQVIKTMYIIKILQIMTVIKIISKKSLWSQNNDLSKKISKWENLILF